MTTRTQLAPPPAGTYRIDPDRSTVAYSGRHLFGLGGVHASFSIREGALQVADPPSASTATVVVDSASFRSGSARRDSDIRSAKFLDVASYPDIVFRCDGLRQDEHGWTASGTVTAHGTEVPVEVVVDDVRTQPDGVRLHARAERLDRFAFGLTQGKGMAGRYLDLDLDVVAVRA